MPETRPRTRKAGAIILSGVDRSRVLLLGSGRWNDWQFPKGHVDPGENELQTMHREVKEEAGLEVIVLRELPVFRYSNAPDGDIDLRMYCVRSKDDAALKTEFPNDELLWVPYDAVGEKLSYDNLKRYYAAVLPEILPLIIEVK
jgi:bis(5'-nucleosidyl)-tetraphosphatase